MDPRLALPANFQKAFLAVSVDEREAWFDDLLGIAELPVDEEALPRGCVPYLPSALSVLLSAIELGSISATDTFVDLGSGLGRALIFVHLFTGAAAQGIEIQSGLVSRAREIAASLGLPRVSTLAGDASELIRSLDTEAVASVYFLYCPFGGEHLQKTLRALELKARGPEFRLCTVDVPLLTQAAFRLESSLGGLAVYRASAEAQNS
jgi:SAM-dependent methyltransferase